MHDAQSRPGFTYGITLSLFLATLYSAGLLAVTALQISHSNLPEDDSGRQLGEQMPSTVNVHSAAMLNHREAIIHMY